LLTHGTQGQERNVTPSHSAASFLALECQVQSGPRDNEEGHTGHPDGPAERQSEDVHDEGERWLAKYEGIPATTLAKKLSCSVTHGLF
jgi:hypothetical protein